MLLKDMFVWLFQYGNEGHVRITAKLCVFVGIFISICFVVQSTHYCSKFPNSAGEIDKLHHPKMIAETCCYSLLVIFAYVHKQMLLTFRKVRRERSALQSLRLEHIVWNESECRWSQNEINIPIRTVIR